MYVTRKQAFGPLCPAYETVLQLSEKIHAFPIPLLLHLPDFGDGPMDNLSQNVKISTLVLQRHMVLIFRECGM